MDPLAGLNLGLGALPLMSRARTRSVSAENPSGAKGKGGMAVPDPESDEWSVSSPARTLGQGWKVRPYVWLRSGETTTLMDVEGPGVVQHIWMTTQREWRGSGRGCVLRFYWDGEETPSVEVPLTDFFAVGHDLYAPVNSLAVIVNPTSALNCYWAMPFRGHAKVTITNEWEEDLRLFYQITYAETEVPENAGYFHAQWRRAVTDRSNPDYTILDGVEGQGQYVGTFLAWTQLSDGWFGEGEIKFFIDGDWDGDAQFPTICGTGTEDYFLGSYGFPEVYTTAYVGNTLKHPGSDGPPKWSLYRWHILDPIRFEEDLRVTIQALGWWPEPNSRFQPLADDIASVAYWYQTPPHAAFPELPGIEERYAR